MPWLPDVPTLEEQGIKGVEGQTFTGLLAPAGTPRPVVDKLSAAHEAGARGHRGGRRSSMPRAPRRTGTSPQDFTEYLQKEESTWLPIIKAANIKAE